MNSGRNVNNRLRIVRIVGGLTQYGLRNRTGINTAKISLIENGYIQPSDEEKEVICKALNVSVEEVFPKHDSQKAK